MTNYKFQFKSHLLLAFGASFLSIGSVLAAPTATSATLQNPSFETVELEVIGSDFGSVNSLNNIVFNGLSPLDAEVKNNSTLVLTFDIEAGTGKTGSGLTITPGTIQGSDSSNQLIFLPDDHITDQAPPAFLARRTLDRDSDGKMDGLELVASEALNDDLDDFEIDVFDYEVKKVSTGDSPNDNLLLVEVDELDGACDFEELLCDTDAAPEVLIAQNTTLKDLATHPNVIPSELLAIVSHDGIAPRLLAASFSRKPLNNILYNTLTLTYSEPVIGSSRLDSSDDLIDGEGVLSSPDLGALNASGLAGLAELKGGFDVTTSLDIGNEVRLDQTGTELTVYFNVNPESYFSKGDFNSDNIMVNPIANVDVLSDWDGNAVNAERSVTAEILEPWDLEAPALEMVYSCDADFDGNIDRLQLTFSEDVLDQSTDASHWRADQNAFNERSGEKLPANINTATANCDGEGDDPDPDDNQFRLELDEQVAGTDAAHVHLIENGLRDHAGNRTKLGDNLGDTIDRAAPVITEFIYQDRNGGNGKMDQFTIVFSEKVDAAQSHLAPDDLRLTRVGDFVGAEFGLSQESQLIDDINQATIHLGQEALVVDSYEDSGQLQIQSQNQFLLADVAGNTNDRHEIQNQATFQDGMKPWIKAFGYEDRDQNGLIDAWMIAFSEAVTEASHLSPNDLLIQSGLEMQFESDVTDFIHEPTLAVTMPLREQIEVDLIKDAEISFVTQNQFALSDGIEVNADKMLQSQASVLPAPDIVLGSLPIEESAFESDVFTPLTDDQFTDVDGHWAEAYIADLVDQGVVSGKSADRFAPDDPLTRAELIKMATLAFGYEIPQAVSQASFSDVQPAVWYAPFIQAAKQEGLIEGEDGLFYPNRAINRAEALKILIEAAEFEDVNQVYIEDYASKEGWYYVFFPDVLIGEWYAKYVAYAKEVDLVGGFPDRTFRPQNTITRAEAAKILAKVLSIR